MDRRAFLKASVAVAAAASLQIETSRGDVPPPLAPRPPEPERSDEATWFLTFGGELVADDPVVFGVTIDGVVTLDSCVQLAPNFMSTAIVRARADSEFGLKIVRGTLRPGTKIRMMAMCPRNDGGYALVNKERTVIEI